MTTTIGTVALPHANAAYQAAMRRAQPGLATEDAAVMPRFDAFLKTELSAATQDLRAGETASVKALTGRADLQQVVEAVTKAELSLQKVTAIRDRVISAYQEIMRMPI